MTIQLAVSLVLTYGQMVLHIPFQYITDLIVSLRHEWQGVGGSDDTN